MENFEVSDAGDILVDTKQLDWLDVGGGTYFKILIMAAHGLYAFWLLCFMEGG